MLRFKDYHSDEKILLGEEINHDIVADKAAFVEGRNSELLGKKKSTAVREFPGDKFEFGKKGKEYFVVDKDGKRHTSEEDIESTHGKGQKSKDLKDLFLSLPKLLPRTGGHYVASLHRFEKDDDGHHSTKNGEIMIQNGSKHAEKLEKKPNFSLMVYGKKNINGEVKNTDTTKLDHPDVHVIPAKIREFDPSQYTPDEQEQYAKHMLNAKTAYAKLDSDVFDRLGKHSDEIQRFVNSRQDTNPPKHDEYVEYLKDRHKSDSSLGNKQNDNRSRRLADLLSGMKKTEINNLLSFNHGLTKANEVINGVIEKQANNDGVYGHKGIK